VKSKLEKFIGRAGQLKASLSRLIDEAKDPEIEKELKSGLEGVEKALTLAKQYRIAQENNQKLLF
jgi:hypothetical protein